MHTSKTISFLLIVLFIVLPSCGNRNGENEVDVKVIKMEQAEINSLFNGRGRYLSKGSDYLIPLRVIIENRGSRSITVKPATMAIVDSQIIYKKVAKNVAGITAGATIGGFFLAGPIGAAAFGSGFGISNARKNEEIINQISEYAFVETKEVHPKSSFSRIMFVRKHEFRPIFTLPIGSKAFEINLA